MTARLALRLVLGCVVLGLGVALLLGPSLGSDGYSTLVNGIALTSGWPFVAANLAVSAGFVALAASRRLRPRVGTVVQVVVVGIVVQSALPHLDPSTLGARIAMLVLALPVISAGIALYLDTGLGAGPAEGAALAWDPPIPFAWSYSAVQGGGALVGWLLGAAIGPGTVAVILLLGPAIALVGRLFDLDVSANSDRSRKPRRP